MSISRVSELISVNSAVVYPSNKSISIDDLFRPPHPKHFITDTPACARWFNHNAQALYVDYVTSPALKDAPAAELSVGTFSCYTRSVSGGNRAFKNSFNLLYYCCLFWTDTSRPPISIDSTLPSLMFGLYACAPVCVYELARNRLNWFWFLTPTSRDLQVWCGRMKRKCENMVQMESLLRILSESRMVWVDILGAKLRAAIK